MEAIIKYRKAVVKALFVLCIKCLTLVHHLELQ